jgi:hypothetical protein
MRNAPGSILRLAGLVEHPAVAGRRRVGGVTRTRLSDFVR